MLHSTFFKQSPYEFVDSKGDDQCVLDHAQGTRVLYSMMAENPVVEIFTSTPVRMDDDKWIEYQSFLRKEGFTEVAIAQIVEGLTNPCPCSISVDSKGNGVITGTSLFDEGSSLHYDCYTRYDRKVTAYIPDLNINICDNRIYYRRCKMSGVSAPNMTKQTSATCFDTNVDGEISPTLGSVSFGSRLSAIDFLRVVISRHVRPKRGPSYYTRTGSVYPISEKGWAKFDHTLNQIRQRGVKIDDLVIQQYKAQSIVYEREQKIRKASPTPLINPTSGLPVDGYWITYNPAFQSKCLHLTELAPAWVSGAYGVKGVIRQNACSLTKKSMVKLGLSDSDEEAAKLPPGVAKYAWVKNPLTLPVGVFKLTNTYKNALGNVDGEEPTISKSTLLKTEIMDGRKIGDIDIDIMMNPEVRELAYFYEDYPSLTEDYDWEEHYSPYAIDLVCIAEYDTPGEFTNFGKYVFDLRDSSSNTFISAPLSESDIFDLTMRKGGVTESKVAKTTDALNEYISKKHGFETFYKAKRSYGKSQTDVIDGVDSEFVLEHVMSNGEIDIMKLNPIENPGTGFLVGAMTTGDPSLVKQLRIGNESLYGSSVANMENYTENFKSHAKA